MFRWSPMLSACALALGGVLLASCSAEERAYSSGSGGAGGTGAGGASCTADADCDDGLACNGVEACAAGTCTPGAPACESPDPHCEPACTEGSPSPTCGALIARDTDKDGHGDASCSVAPGDDCNDASPAAAPGQPETCDGLDNDCDGLADLDDLVPLSGASTEVGGSDQLRQSIAYAPLPAVYGITSVFLEVPEIFFRTVDQTGAVVTGTTSVGSFKYAEQIIPRIAAFGVESFGVVWHDEDMSTDAVFLQRVGPDGAAIGERIDVSAPQLGARLPDIVAEESGSAVVVWQNYGAIFARRIGLDGSLQGTEVQISPPQQGATAPRIVRRGNQFGVVWKTVSGVTQGIQFARLDAGLSSVGGIEQLAVDTILKEPTIAADGGGYTIVWRADPKQSLFHIVRRDEAGVALCDATMPSGRPSGDNELVAGPSGVLLLEPTADASGENASQLVRIGPTCTAVGNPIRVSEAAVTEEGAARAVGAAGKAGFAVAWANYFGSIETNEKLMVRTFGPNLCD